jgi:hypothetical protein
VLISITRTFGKTINNELVPQAGCGFSPLRFSRELVPLSSGQPVQHRQGRSRLEQRTGFPSSRG